MKSLIIANWKCNPATKEEAKTLFEGVKGAIKKTKKIEVLIAAPFVWLPLINDVKKCAQNCLWEEKGPYTGEISPKMLKDIGVDYVIIGHSERRNKFNETDETINKKIKAALSAGLIVILCVGENKGENAQEVITKQLEADLKEISVNDYEKIIIAYEPIWAIGTGDFCETCDAEKVLKFIKDKYSNRILYGGSVDSKNIKSYIDIGFDGALVGGASIKTEEFVNLIKNVED